VSEASEAWGLSGVGNKELVFFCLIDGASNPPNIVRGICNYSLLKNHPLITVRRPPAEIRSPAATYLIWKKVSYFYGVLD